MSNAKDGVNNNRELRNDTKKLSLSGAESARMEGRWSIVVSRGQMGVKTNMLGRKGSMMRLEKNKS